MHEYSSLLNNCRSQNHCIVTFVEPLAHDVPDDEVEALTVVVPCVTSVASPGVVENVSTPVLPDVQVALLVTSLLLLSVAVN
jgi:hypothetical protein